MMDVVASAKSVALVDFQLELTKFALKIIHCEPKEVHSIVLSCGITMLQIAERMDAQMDIVIPDPDDNGEATF
jgi:hypothetical protein